MVEKMSEKIQLAKSKFREISKKNFIFLTVVFLIAAAISLVYFDVELTRSLTTKKYPEYYTSIRFLTDFGEGVFYFGFVLILWGLSWVTRKYLQLKNKPTYSFLNPINSWCKFAFTAMLASGIAIQALKHIIGRQRPHISDGLSSNVFDFFTLNWHNHSMPSGHSQTLFTFTTIVWITFPKLSKWIFLIPAVIASTRVPLEQHFLSDVIMGSYFGIAVTVFIAGKFKLISFK